MLLTGAAYYTTPALRYQLGFDTNALKAKGKSAIHSRHREPHFRSVQFQQRFQDRESQLILIYQLSRSLTNDLMEMSLNCEKHSDRHVPLILRLELGQKRLMALLPRDVDGSFTARVLKSVRPARD